MKTIEFYQIFFVFWIHFYENSQVGSNFEHFCSLSSFDNLLWKLLDRTQFQTLFNFLFQTNRHGKFLNSVKFWIIFLRKMLIRQHFLLLSTVFHKICWIEHNFDHFFTYNNLWIGQNYWTCLFTLGNFSSKLLDKKQFQTLSFVLKELLNYG